MKLLVIHDAKGNISGLVTLPDKAPPGAVASRIGHLVTQVDAPEVIGDLSDAKNHARLIDLLKTHRIDVKADGKIVKKGASKG